MLNDDYRDMLRALSDEGASFLLVGQQEGTIFQIGGAPRRIDLITEATGL